MKPNLESYLNNINSIQTKMDDFDEKLKIMKNEIKMSLNESGDSGILNEIKSINELLTDDSHHRQIDDLDIKVQMEQEPISADRHMTYFEQRMKDRRQELAEAIDSLHSRNMWIMIGLILSVVGAGGFYYYKLVAYEKKAHLI